MSWKAIEPSPSHVLESSDTYSAQGWMEVRQDEIRTTAVPMIVCRNSQRWSVCDSMSDDRRGFTCRSRVRGSSSSRGDAFLRLLGLGELRKLHCLRVSFPVLSCKNLKQVDVLIFFIIPLVLCSDWRDFHNVSFLNWLAKQIFSHNLKAVGSVGRKIVIEGRVRRVGGNGCNGSSEPCINFLFQVAAGTIERDGLSVR
jgi:hypothetical protein